MKKWRKRMSLRAVMVVFVFFIILVTMVGVGACMMVMIRLFGFSFMRGGSPFAGITVMVVFSVILGTALAALVSNRTLKPLRKIIDATQKVAAGDFSVRLETDSVPEIEDLTDSFNTMVRELDSIETLRSDFVSNFSHEFKTPIVSIRGFAKLLRNPGLPEDERAEYIEIIVQESERLAGLATNVLDLSRLENTGILAEKQCFVLDEQIRRAAALMEHRWREKDITVTLEMERVTVCSDEDLLQQVWVNLLDNAIKFTGEGGAIDISLKMLDGGEAGESVVFTIADDGPGMDAATQAHLFDKFYQGDKSHSGSGNGLGLSLVKRIVALCGGEIAVESSPGTGSTFTVTLPAGTEAKQA